MRAFIVLLIASIVIMTSCNRNEFYSDVSDIEIPEVKFKLLYSDEFDCDTSQLIKHFSKMDSKYGSFYKKYLTSVFGNDVSTDSSYEKLYKGFVSDKDLRSDYARIKSIYKQKEIEDLEATTTLAFKHAKKLFPDTSLPKQFVLMYTGLNFRNVNVDSTLAIGLDFYLGKDAPSYNMTQSPFPEYKKRLMEKEFILRDMMMAWVIQKFDQNEPEKNLLESMVEAGKFFYCTKRLLPELEDSILFGYTTTQIEYCEKYEKDLWKFFSEKNRLYLNDMKEIIPYNTDGPFTAAISKDCPPAIARYMGYKIVCAYMKKNPELKLPELMKDNDFQKIMVRAKYKP